MTPDSPAPSIRDDLRAAITRAMKSRDRTALAVYRSALAAIDNAEAIPVTDSQRAGAIEATEVGLGRTEAVRRDLSEQDAIDIVAAEAVDRRSTAKLLGSTAPDQARALLHEADLLQALAERQRADGADHLP